MPAMVLNGDKQLRSLLESLSSSGSKGKKAIRKGMRAGAKVVADRVKETFPKKTGNAARSTRVRALKRKKGRIGVRVTLFAASAKGYPYPMALESGAKYQPSGGRVRKAVKKVTVRGSGKRVTDEARSGAYHALSWRIPPGHWTKKAFDAVASRAQSQMLSVTSEAFGDQS